MHSSRGNEQGAHRLLLSLSNFLCALGVLILYDTNPAQANSRYFRLHNERNATDWAGEYLTAHHDEMRVWEIKIMKTLKKVLDKIIDE